MKKTKPLVFLDPAPVHLDDPEPKGYLEWHEWVRLQLKAKRKQVRCKKCHLYWWPHTGYCRGCGGGRGFRREAK